VAELSGGLDVLIPNAGILPMGSDVDVSGFAASVDVNLIGVLNTVHAALPHLSDGASVILSGSIASLLDPIGEDEAPEPIADFLAAALQVLGARKEKIIVDPYTIRFRIQQPVQGLLDRAAHDGPEVVLDTRLVDLDHLAQGGRRLAHGGGPRWWLERRSPKLQRGPPPSSNVRNKRYVISPARQAPGRNSAHSSYRPTDTIALAY
jgi:hypothetical protein